MGREKSRAEPPRGRWPSIAVIRPVLRRDLLDKKTNILSGERATVVLKGNVRIRAVQVGFNANPNLSIDIHVLGVLDQLPDPAPRCRGRSIYTGTELRHLLMDFRRDVTVVGLVLRRRKLRFERHEGPNLSNQVYWNVPSRDVSNEVAFTELGTRNALVISNRASSDSRLLRDCPETGYADFRSVGYFEEVGRIGLYDLLPVVPITPPCSHDG